MIDADALKHEIAKMPCVHGSEGSWTCIQDALDVVNAAPTIEAEPVVHCKDCKWWNRNTIGSDGFAICNEMNGQSYWRGSDYCSWSVKKDEVE